MINKKISIGMSTFDDYEGLFFTIQSIRMHHYIKDIEFIIIDNNPDSIHGTLTKKFITNSVKNGIYVPYTEIQSSFSKYKALEYATGDYYVGIDCHVLLMPSFFPALIKYFDNPNNHLNIAQGPLIYDDLKSISTHFKPEWRGGMYGVWALDDDNYKKGVPFEIDMTGMGMFTCIPKNFPKINPNFSGFGAEEWYIQEKFRQNGGKCVCVPDMLWMHRFNRPMGVPFTNTWEDRIRNYYIGWKELYGNEHTMIASIKEHFQTILSEEKIDSILKDIIC
jgi:hypothetical protein